MINSFFLSKNGLSLNEFYKIVIKNGEYTLSFSLSKEVKDQVVQSRRTLESLISSNKVIYGVNTGFGNLVNHIIGINDQFLLQKNLIMSHSVGRGDSLPEDITRGALLLLINSLSKGKSGIRIETLLTLISLLNSQLKPIIPSLGSLGASGDLAPLAHLALILLGSGLVKTQQGDIISGNKALNLLKLSPLKLEAKEGLALINGTHFMTSSLLLAIRNSINAIIIADVNIALLVEVMAGNINAFNEKLLENRPFLGQLESSRIVCDLLIDSTNILESKVIQDAYSIRCSPQVHGAIRDTLYYILQQVKIELNSVTDNPIIIDNNNIYSGGLFHGEPISLLSDFLAIALTELASISERRINRLLDPSLNRNLPPFLIKSSGLNSGLMIVQYTVASIVSHMRHLASPNSIDNISVSANQEDHVSMGLHAALKAYECSKLILEILSGELFCLRQALGFRDNQRFSPKIKKIYKKLSDF
ncbi:MAG: histidine ammonia-lyase, partial [Candidatus Thorarchaeota archaeon]